MIRRPASNPINFKEFLSQKIETISTGSDFDDPNRDDIGLDFRVDTRCGAFGFYPGDVIKIVNPDSISIDSSPKNLYLVLGVDIDDEEVCLALVPIKTRVKHGVEVMTATECYTTFIYANDVYENYGGTYDVGKFGLRIKTCISLVYRLGALHIDSMRQVQMKRILEDLSTETPRKTIYQTLEADI